MAKTTLSTEQTRQLVHQLATNDAFRSSFETNPAKALATLGIEQAVIDGLDAKCLQPCKLGSKDVFQKANANLDEVTAQAYSSFLVPALRIGTPR
ncbi:MAG: NHLP-related RiPP peptide [Dokdonella sp.]|uniref:NHLP-related RiPP peptide n=1 Tax=Dokdonella sp. TaxID=2291710 RepID=UPI0025C3E6FD|nr:NHLP-related RiPP peptide [Dokdonella sp.]MBZ0221917.1 NHLP-related RiPP peptide [Dokdonella sp.]